MTPAHQHYLTIARELPDAEESQLFGKPCFKVEGKAFVSFFDDAMVFKLHGKAHEDAFLLPDAKLFDPSGKGRAMKEWVQVPFIYAELWPRFAKEARNYVSVK